MTSRIECIAVTCAARSNQLVANLNALDISEGNIASLGVFTVVRHHGVYHVVTW